MSGSPGGRLSAVVLLGSGAALVASLFVAVRLDGAAREAITTTDSLRQELQSAREELNRAARRADSLSSRRRVLRAAEGMGFRAPEDAEVRFLPELGPGADTEGESRGSGQ